MTRAVKKAVRKAKPPSKLKLTAKVPPGSLTGAISRAKIRSYRDAKVAANDRQMYETELGRLQGEIDKVTRGLITVQPSIPERIAQLKSLLK